MNVPAVASWYVGPRPGWGIVPLSRDRSASHYEEWTMPRSQGFARGDIDTAFPLDDKFLSLRGRLSPDRYYAAVGVYFTIVAATWREADRKPGIRVAPDAGDFLDELVSAGLLDGEGRVTTRAFASWVGSAKKKRKSASDRQAKNRAGMSRVTNGDNRVTNSQSQPTRETEGTVYAGTVGTEEDVAREDDALDVYYRLTGSFPSGTVKDWLSRLANEFGHRETGNAVAAEYVTGPRNTILSRVQNRLRSDVDKAERTRAANAQAQIVDKAKRETPEEKADREARYNALRAELSVVKGMS
jgi:hypothetical protein